MKTGAKIIAVCFALCCRLLLLPSAYSQKVCLSFPGMPFTDTLIHDVPINSGVDNALAKARMVAGIEWNPLLDVPSVYTSGPYQAGSNCLGLPYSLAQKVNGLIGHDVTLYTFMTALHNPRSVMYTENLKLAPYYGFDAAPYYGSVCSSSVWYVIGVKAPYYSSSINGIAALTKRQDLPPDSIQLCDVLWHTGHVAMIYDIGRDTNDSIRKVVVFETTRASGLDSKLNEYTFEGFKNRWNNGGYMIYRPKDLTQNPEPEEGFLWSNGHLTPKFEYNDDLCTSRGDQVAYPVGDSVVINIFNHNYSYLELYKDDDMFQRVPIDTSDVVFYDLPYGSYKARLANEGGGSSAFIHFEVIDINVSYTLQDNKVRVYFSSANATPVFMSLGDERECPYYITIFNENQLQAGSALVTLSSYYLKVHFRGQYGQVSNRLIHIEQNKN